MPMGIGLGIGVTRGGGLGWWQSGSALDLDFANSLGFNSIDRTKLTPDSILTYTAPSPKMVYGSDGVLRYAPHNLLLQSQTLDSGTWMKLAVAVTGASINAAVAPDGTLTADKVVATNTANTGRCIYQDVAALSSAIVFSVYAKADEYYLVRLIDLNSYRFYATFNLVTGLVSAAGGANYLSSSMTDVGGGWWRLTIFTTTITAAFAPSFVGFPDTVTPTNTPASYAGDGVSGVYFWGAQLQRTPNHSNAYIPTTTAARYSLPIDHNPTTFAPLGVLIEEQRTNLCLYSDDFTNAAWVKSNLTAAKTATGPDGVANSASTLTATAANATARQDVTSASAARITSMFVKRRTGTGAVYLSQGGTTGSELVVNGTFTTDTTGWTASGATLAVVSSELEVTNTGAAAGIADSDAFATVVGTAYLVGYTARRGTSSSVGIEVRTTSGSAETSITLTNTSNVDGFLYFIASTTSTFIRVSSNQAVLGRTGYFDNLSVKAAVETTVTVTSDWTRVATASATITNPPLIIRMATSGDAIDVDLFQHELGAFITSPVPTVASQVTRAADQVSILTSAFGYNAAAGTFAVEADSTPILTSTAMSLFSFTTTDNDLTTLYFANTVTDSRLLIYDAAGVLQVLLDDDVVPVSNQMKKLAFAFAANDVAFVGQGGAVKTDASVTLGVPTTLKIGANRSSSITQSINGHIKRLTYFPTRRSNADLQVLST